MVFKVSEYHKGNDMQQVKGFKNPKEYLNIKLGFLRQGSSLHQFCTEHGINRRHVYRVFKGTWTGEKATALKNKVSEAARGKK